MAYKFFFFIEQLNQLKEYVIDFFPSQVTLNAIVIQTPS